MITAADTAQGAVAAELAKRYSDRGITLAPATCTDPGEPRPEEFDRGYVSAGHASASPEADHARSNPLPMLHPGYPQSIALSSQVMAAQIPNAVVQSYSLGSPSER